MSLEKHGPAYSMDDVIRKRLEGDCFHMWSLFCLPAATKTTSKSSSFQQLRSAPPMLHYPSAALPPSPPLCFIPAPLCSPSPSHLIHLSFSAMQHNSIFFWPSFLLPRCRLSNAPLFSIQRLGEFYCLCKSVKKKKTFCRRLVFHILLGATIKTQKPGQSLI